MEPAKIDWKRIESVFVEDTLYENISAPKWVDFLAPVEASVDDEAWFCRPDCKHPKTAEDFLKTPPSSKFQRSLERLPFGDRNHSDSRMKRQGKVNLHFHQLRNPNSMKIVKTRIQIQLPPQNQVKSMKMAIKSNSEKNKLLNDNSQNNEVFPRLKSTMSARNLFGGKDILSHITEFCNELKKLATRARERESAEKLNEKNSQVGVKKEVVKEKPSEVLGVLDRKAKERKPLLEMDKENSEGVEKGSAKKDKQRRKERFDEAENIPVSLNLENIKNKGDKHLLQIRTNPPSPQCFSAIRTASKTTPSKSSTYRSMERGILREAVEQKVPADKGTSVPNSIVEGREARALDVFWFLKPCTLSGLKWLLCQKYISFIL